MPEGDTIHRTARTLRDAASGKVIRRFASTRILSRDLAGRRITAVEAHGKHLLLRLDDGRAIQAHMGMTGSVHLYRPKERWRRPEGMARMVIEVAAETSEPAELVIVAFAVPTLRLIVALAERPREIAHLGPDVLSAEFDAAAAAGLLRARGELPIGVAIMDQSAVAGVGNIYKSETLFTLGVDPFAPVSTLSDETLTAIVERARRLMTSNLRGGMRTTTTRVESGQKFYVYRRSGRPCVRCGALIEMRRQGEHARSTYYCPRCQLGRARPR